MDCSSIIGTIIGAVVSGLIGWVSANYTLKKTEHLKRINAIKRISRQLQYLIDLYERTIHFQLETQKDINTSTWEPDIFIYETNYKADLSYLNLPSQELQQILSWFYQWEVIGKNLNEYIPPIGSPGMTGYTFLNGRCGKQKNNLNRLLPEMKKFVKRLEESIKE